MIEKYDTESIMPIVRKYHPEFVEKVLDNLDAEQA